MKKKEKHVVTIVVGPIFGRARAQPARPVPPGLYRTEWKRPGGRPDGDKPGSASWRSMSGSLQMLLGTWLVHRDVWRAQLQPIAGQAVQSVSQ